MAKTKVLICPYCGETQTVGERCVACGGLFEPLSRQATHNAMGPWFVRNMLRPFQPGCSYETLVKMVERGQVTKVSIVRGPTSKQFWTAARRLPGIAHLLGYCHNCDASVDPGDHGCHSCGVPFGAYLDRNYLGLPEVKPLPWEAPIVDDRGGVTGSRGIDWQRAAEPMGISSFASDRELRGGGLGASGGYFGAPVEATSTTVAIRQGPAGEIGVAMTERGLAVGTPLAEHQTSSAAYRSLQRRMQRQRSTIRLLAVGLVAVAALAVLAIAARLAGSGSSPNRTSPPVTTTTSPTPATSAPAATIPAVNVDEEIRRAEELLAEAREDDRSIDDRIASYEQAQKVLSAAASTATGEADRQVQELLKAAAHELEQLRLKQYFP